MEKENTAQTDSVLIDEIGHWELRQQGWTNSLTSIVENYNKPIVLVVRSSIIDKVISHIGDFEMHELLISKQTQNHCKMFKRF